MSKILKIFAGIVVLLIVALGIFISTFDVNHYKDDLIEIVEENTGRDFDIAGELRLGFSLIPTIVVDGVSMGNATWGTRPAMVTVEHFSAKVSLLSLLSGGISINEIILDSADILLETNKEGVGNWEFAVKEENESRKKDADDTAPPELSIDEVSIKNTVITFKDGQAGKTTQVSIDQFILEAGGFNDPMDILLQAVYNEIPLNVDGNIGSINNLKNNDEFPMDIRAKVGNAELSLKGNVDKPKDLKGLDVQMNFKTESFADFEKISGEKLPAIGSVKMSGIVMEEDGTYFIKTAQVDAVDSKLGIDGKIADIKNMKGLDLIITFEAESLTRLGEVAETELPPIGPIKLTTKLTNKDNGFQLTDLNLNAGKSDFSGNATLNLSGKRPALLASLTSNMIDLTPFSSGEKPDEDKKEKSAKVFSSDPLPFETLKSVDAKLEIKARQVQSLELLLSNVDINLNLDNGHLKLSPVNANVAGGSYSLTLDLDASSGKRGVFDTELDIKNFQPSKLPDMEKQISGASTDFNFKGKGSGASVAEIMAGLNGHLLVNVGEGEIKSDKFSIMDSDLIASTLNTLNPLSSKESSRKIECGVVNMKIEDGIAKSDKNIALLTSRMSVVGSGIINLKTEELNLAVQPTARDGLGISVGNLAELVKVGGTLAEPKAVPDTVAAFKTAASVGAAVATGGISLLAQGLLNKSTADKDPCATAMGVKSAATEEPTDTTTEPSTTEKAVDTVKDAGKSITEGLKGLFD